MGLLSKNVVLFHDRARIGLPGQAAEIYRQHDDDTRAVGKSVQWGNSPTSGIWDWAQSFHCDTRLDFAVAGSRRETAE